MINKKNKKKTPKFNPYWVYGGMIILIILYTFSSGVTSNNINQASPSKFLNMYLMVMLKKLI